MIAIIVTVLVLVYKRFCNTVYIYGHANKAVVVVISALDTLSTELMFSGNMLR